MGRRTESTGLVTTAVRPPYPDPRIEPWPGFALAADAAVQQLAGQLGMDLWLVTHVQGDDQLVVAAAGPWVDMTPVGTTLSWPESFCLRMVRREGPMIAPDVRAVPAYAEAATGVLARVSSYVGVPLLRSNGELVGTLCAFAGSPQPKTLTRSIGLLQLVGRMLSTILAREEVARERSEDAARAYALAERDRLTGLRNRRGWESALAQEYERSSRYGSSASVIVVDLDGLKHVNDHGGHASGDALLAGCAAVLQDSSRPGDVLARLGGDEFGVLAVECDSIGARALRLHLLTKLRSAGIAASAGAATRRAGETPDETVRRADEAMYRDKRRRAVSAAPPPSPGSS